jgi:hypothetical protein
LSSTSNSSRGRSAAANHLERLSARGGLERQRAGDRAENELGIAERRELDEACAVGERAPALRGRRQGESCLPRAPGPGQHEQPHSLDDEQPTELGELALAAEQTVRRHRQRRLSLLLRRCERQRRVVLKDAALKLAQLRAGFEPELLAQAHLK